jgi:hypothetical protein
MNQRLEAERELIRSTLDLSELELLAEQSQRLLDDALARAGAKHVAGTVIDAVAALPERATPVDTELPEATVESSLSAIRTDESHPT